MCIGKGNIRLFAEQCVDWFYLNLLQVGCFDDGSDAGEQHNAMPHRSDH